MINWLHIENFTVFRDVDFRFVPGINVLVGANATGKTHVMKLLYAIQKAHIGWSFSVQRDDDPPIDKSLVSVFQPEDERDLVRHPSRTP